MSVFRSDLFGETLGARRIHGEGFFTSVARRKVLSRRPATPSADAFCLGFAV